MGRPSVLEDQLAEDIRTTKDQIDRLRFLVAETRAKIDATVAQRPHDSNWL